MLNFRVRIILSLLLVLVLAVQFIPGAFENNERLYHCGQLFFTLPDDTEYSDLALLDEDDRKIKYSLISIETCIFSFRHNLVAHFLETNTVYHAIPVDQRKEIQRVFSHCFHGGKYKENSLFI